MAGSYLSKLVVLLSANTASFDGDMGKAAHVAAKRMEQIQRSVDSAVKTIQGLAGAFSVVQIAGFAKGIIDSADKLQDMSNRTGIAVKELAALDFMASQTGATAEGLAKGMRTLDVAITEVASGGDKNMKSLFEQLGLKDLTTGAVTGTDALLRLADVFPRLTESQRELVASKLGKTFYELIPALSGGREEMERMLKTGKDLSGGIEELAKEANTFNDNTDKLSRSIKSSLNPALIAFVSQMNEALDGMTALEKAGYGFWDRLFTGALPAGQDAGKAITEYSGKLSVLKKTMAELEAMPSWKKRLNEEVFGDINGVGGLKAQISEMEKMLVLAKSKQLGIANAIPAAYGNEGRTGGVGGIVIDDLSGEKAKAAAAAAAKAAAAAAREAAKELAEFVKQGESADKMIKELKGGLAQVGMDDFAKETFMANKKIDEFTKLSVAKRDALKAEALAILEKTAMMKGAMEAEKERKKMEDELTKSNDEFVAKLILEGDETKKLAVEVDRLGQLWTDGIITAEQYYAAIKGTEAYKVMTENTKKAAEAAAEVWHTAAKNIQSSMGDFLVDAMEGNWKSIGAGFTKMLNRMVAEAIAAQIMEKMVGKGFAGGEKGSSVGGWIGMAMSAWGGGKAGGGPVSAGMGYMVGEKGAEFFSPSVSGNITPNSGMGGQKIVNNFTIAQPASRETQSQVAAAAQTGMMRAARRNN